MKKPPRPVFRALCIPLLNDQDYTEWHRASDNPLRQHEMFDRIWEQQKREIAERKRLTKGMTWATPKQRVTALRSSQSA